MKNWQITGFLAILILGFILMSGCTSTGSTSTTPVATPTPQIVYVTVTVTPTPTPSPSAVSKTVLFSDDLSQWRSGWEEEYDYSDGKTFYSGGSLHIRDNKPPTGSIYHTLNRNFNDFILDVDTKAVAGTLNNFQGVFVRGNGEENYYAFLISADGYYNIQKNENDNLVNLVGGTRSGSIKTGTGATNHIHVEVNKNTFSLSVNGDHVRTVTDNTFREGTVSMMANSLTSDSFSEVVFNNLVITQI